MSVQRSATLPLRTAVASLALCSLRGPPGALDLDVYWPAQLCCVWPRTWSRLPTALRSPELSLVSFKRQLKTHSSVPELVRQCWLQLCVSCTVVRRCCDCTASSAPTTNLQTRLDWTPRLSVLLVHSTIKLLTESVTTATTCVANSQTDIHLAKRLCCRRRTARRAVSTEMLSITNPQQIEDVEIEDYS